MLIAGTRRTRPLHRPTWAMRLRNSESSSVRLFIWGVPVLTRCAYIKLNERVLLRCHRNRVVISLPDIAQSSGPIVARPSVEHIPAGGFVCRYKSNATQVD